MDKEYINYVHEMSKTLKSDIVCVIGNTMYGIDKGCTYLKRTCVDNPNNYTLCYIYKDMVQVLKEDFNIMDNYIITESGKVPLVIHTYINHILRMNTKINNIITGVNPNVTKSDKELKSDNYFMEIINSKVSDGGFIYSINSEYIMTLYKGLIPLNKKDTVNLYIYDLGNMFLSFFEIYKSKMKNTIYEYILYLKIH